MLECKIHFADMFFDVLSDGYNPVNLYIANIEAPLDDEDEVFKKSTFQFPFQNKGRWDSKVEFDDLNQKLEEDFDWILDHLKMFTIAPKIFESNFHSTNLKEIAREIILGTIDLVKDWSLKFHEYYIDLGGGSESKCLLLLGNQKAVCICFVTTIH